ncbi:MAG: hypothetical protein QM706_00850 [Nitrospira sp.]
MTADFARDAKKQAFLAHTRLSIIDLSSAGHQPMSSADGRFTIVFNGEIYNFRELKAQLLTQGFDFHSDSDTEVILKLYEAEGAQCVQKLRGMFAFAIWDSQRNTGFLARDSFGIKPLYYAEKSGCSILLQSFDLCSHQVLQIVVYRLRPFKVT